MSKEKQIEEMQIEEMQIEEMQKVINCAVFADFKNGHSVCIKTIADHLYNAGYRKRSELTPCDVCKFNPPTSGDNKPCFICPAQMKGGAE